MLYSMFVLLCGIYIGQEYPNVPSVKRMTLATIEFLKQDSESHQHLYKSYYDLFRQVGSKSQ